MDLNLDCVRDILLACEKAKFDELIYLPELQQACKGYGIEELEYCCLRMDEGGLIKILTADVGGDLFPRLKCVVSMTWDGHQLLEKIRNPERWGAVKKGTLAIKDYSLSAITAVAEGIAGAGLNYYLSNR